MFPLLNQQIVAYIKGLYHKYQQPYLLYHNLAHTEYVVKKVEEIAAHYSINQTENFILAVAAWFHDTGQLLNYGRNHEMKSASLMREFMLQNNIEAATINKIETCILATQMPHHPESLLEEIMCDADTYNLGTEDFLHTDKLLKEECELKELKKNDHWYENSLHFLEHHKYFTSYCNTVLKEGKRNNINILLAKVHSMRND